MKLSSEGYDDDEEGEEEMSEIGGTEQSKVDEEE